MLQQPLLFQCRDNEVFPNSRLPVILYRQAVWLPMFFRKQYLTLLFGRHHWTNVWAGGVAPFHHYHSTTHVTLGFYRGNTVLLLGGESGHRVTVGKGDVLIIPAGVAHKNLGKVRQAKCVGAYPNGRYYDLFTGQPGERPTADRNIAGVPMPEQDPIYGPRDGLPDIWGLITEGC